VTVTLVQSPMLNVLESDILNNTFTFTDAGGFANPMTEFFLGVDSSLHIRIQASGPTPGSTLSVGVQLRCPTALTSQ